MLVEISKVGGLLRLYMKKTFWAEKPLGFCEIRAFEIPVEMGMTGGGRGFKGAPGLLESDKKARGK